jgi:predicted DNA-binding transcriptional regulator YafY
MQVQLCTNVRQHSLYRTIVRAMREHRAVAVVYTRANGSETVRTIEPYALTRNKTTGDRYVRAMDRQSGETRTFRLDRIAAYGLGDAFRLAVPEPRSEASRATAARMAEADTAAQNEWADIQRRMHAAAVLAVA